jgi:hypothetical protein
MGKQPPHEASEDESYALTLTIGLSFATWRDGRSWTFLW